MKEKKSTDVPPNMLYITTKMSEQQSYNNTIDAYEG